MDAVQLLVLKRWLPISMRVLYDPEQSFVRKGSISLDQGELSMIAVMANKVGDRIGTLAYQALFGILCISLDFTPFASSWLGKAKCRSIYLWLSTDNRYCC